jgi:hypothetical protein
MAEATTHGRDDLSSQGSRTSGDDPTGSAGRQASAADYSTSNRAFFQNVSGAVKRSLHYLEEIGKLDTRDAALELHMARLAYDETVHLSALLLGLSSAYRRGGASAPPADVGQGEDVNSNTVSEYHSANELEPHSENQDRSQKAKRTLRRKEQRRRKVQRDRLERVQGRDPESLGWPGMAPRFGEDYWQTGK